jgi:hypothetical protein
MVILMRTARRNFVNNVKAFLRLLFSPLLEFYDWLSSQKNAWAIVATAGALGIAAGIFFYANLQMLLPLFSRVDNCFFGADTRETFKAFTTFEYHFDYAKRPAYGPTLTALSLLLSIVFGLSATDAVLVAFAFFAGLNVFIVVLLFRWMGLSAVNAIALAILYCLAFANLVIFSIPESYVVTSTALLILLGWLWGHRNLKEARTWEGNAAAGTIAGVASWFNPPLLAALISNSVRQVEAPVSARVVGRCVASCAIGVAISFLPMILISLAKHSTDRRAYLDQWASLNHLLDPSAIGSVIVSFFAVGIVSPFSVVPRSVTGADLVRFLDGGAESVAALVLFVIYLTLTIAVVRGRFYRDPWLLGLFVWIAVLIVFYVFFNPNESFLYASQPVLLLLFCGARILVLTAPQSWIERAVLLAFVLLVAVANLRTLYEIQIPADPHDCAEMPRP